jgi:hypothetical protein
MFEEENPSLFPGYADEEKASAAKLEEIRASLSDGKEVRFVLPASKLIEVKIGDGKSLVGGSERLIGLILYGLVELAENPQFSGLIFTDELKTEKRFCDTIQFRMLKRELEEEARR